MDYACLGNLPTDILVLILGLFCLHCQDEYNKPWDTPPLRHRSPRQKPDEKSWYSVDRQALVSLSLTSRRLRDIAQSILYHEFTLGYDDSWRTNLYTWDGRLISFMRTLAQRRDLACLVKVVYVHPRLLWAINSNRPLDVLGEAAEALGIDLVEIWEPDIPRDMLMNRSIRPTTRELFLAPLLYVPGYVPWYSRDVRTRRRESNWAAAELMAMLIAQLPSLEYLGLQLCSRWAGGDGVSFLSFESLNISSLPFIRRLDIGPCPVDLLRLSPGLETLNLHSPDFLGNYPPLPKLKILRMTDCWLGKTQVECILEACTGGLETFAYERLSLTQSRSSMGGASHRGMVKQFQLSDAVSLLSRHQSTLKSLHLDLSAEGSSVCKIEHGLHLRDFTLLEHLSIGFAMIYGFYGRQEEGVLDSEPLIELLPASLVSLSIQTQQMGEAARENLEKGLVSLAALKERQPDQFPNLGWIQCDLGSETGWLSSMFEGVNVQFKSSSWTLNKAKPYLNGTGWTVDRIIPSTSSDDFSEDELFVPPRQQEEVEREKMSDAAMFQMETNEAVMSESDPGKQMRDAFMAWNRGIEEGLMDIFNRP
ncbi:F-box domain-containing protein [Fusarium sp. LHS14.1]|nr:F-box domain-containing protein [Fusarium sp. LHS14.1]